MGNWSIAADRRAELMDDPALPQAEHHHALDALAVLNAVSLTARGLACGVIRLADPWPPGDGPLRLIDVACGGGDVTLSLAARLAAGLRRTPDGKPRSFELIGLDVSQRAVHRARQLAAGRGIEAVTFEVRDVVHDGCPPCDIAVSSLFLHHLDDDHAIGVLQAMARAAVGGVVSDLVRSRLGLALATLGTTLLSTSRVARIDGPLSVRAARTPAEYAALARRAGMAATVRRVWPERVLIEWSAGPTPRPGDGP